MSHPCPFCSPAQDRIFYADELVVGLWDAFPVSPGHALLVPRRHVALWWEATPQEQQALLAALGHARTAVERQHRPGGYNVGFNAGPVAGQTIDHLHLHLIPRYAGDVPDPRGGIRHVLPARANYLTAAPALDLVAALPHVRSLVRGQNDPLLPHLRASLDRARDADLAVAFVLGSGLARLIEHLRDLLARGGRLRLVAGDYLGVTEPDALALLLDLTGDVHLRVFEAAEVGFHPKAYLFYHPGGTATAYVGSSNLSAAALGTSVEWNYRVVETPQDLPAFADVQSTFEALFQNPRTTPLTLPWIEAYRQRRARLTPAIATVPTEPPSPPPEPHIVQREALEALVATRTEGHRSGLVVLATGLGKTWLATFDSTRDEYKRILFVAHREEILEQALGVFRRVRPQARLGRYTGQEKNPHADVLFASTMVPGSGCWSVAGSQQCPET